MKVFLFLILSHLSVVSAGGYQGCLERVLLYNAYEIDGLNDANAQTVGFKCTKPNLAAKTCPQWNACTPKKNTGRTRCNFDELMVFLGKAPKQTGWSVYDQNGNLAAEQTAKQCYKLFTSGLGNNPKVPNYPPHNAVKDSWEFNDYIKRIGDTANRTYKNKANANNHVLFGSFDTTLEMVSVARAGDHGPFLIQAASNSLGPKMVTIQKQGLGSNPVTGAVWETVDWKETAKQAKARGVANADDLIEAFLKDWYSGPTGPNDPNYKDKVEARNHRVVMQSYKRVTDRSQSCRGG
ncbi:hypothetical protein GGS20DRAFT_594847 [Poronia punctata]|nr:hypothetical protein GGS20DRAFT_594847 [Poronia punctata]